MKIPFLKQLKEWDLFTIQNEPIAGIDLMERAAGKCTEWLLENNINTQSFCIFCGNGNNGGDGLSIARQLSKAGRAVKVFILNVSHNNSPDFETNLVRLSVQHQVTINYITTEKDFPVFAENTIIIEALVGSGLSRPPDGMAKKLIAHINKSNCPIVAIDLPAGMYTDISSAENSIIHATYTLSFQCIKPAFLLAENAPHIGSLFILDIGLDPFFYQQLNAKYQIIDKSLIASFYKKRNPFAHKGNYGHALLLAGSYGKMGAAVLSAKACLRSGAGLLTCHIPGCGYQILQSIIPESMVETDDCNESVTKINSGLNQYKSIGIGPGIGTDKKTVTLLKSVLQNYKKPIIVDADAINCMSIDKSMLDLLPPNSILTPHPKEFERLFGKCSSESERIETSLKSAEQYDIIIVLKGHRSFIALPSGIGYFNCTGNPGMATAGSGDVLTGILTGLIAQGYTPDQAAILGVYMHGLAGDIAAEAISQEAMLASDIIEKLGPAFNEIQGDN
jgi:NAD(P)H-hydrate epimerase